MTHILGVVLRAMDSPQTAQFYSALGLTVFEHEHGGPRHYAVEKISGDFVLEIYRKSENFKRDALMVEVESITAALAVVQKFGIEAHTELKDTGSMKFIYITDPDGRDVILIQKR